LRLFFVEEPLQTFANEAAAGKRQGNESHRSR
jgi:hypothetical protein